MKFSMISVFAIILLFSGCSSSNFDDIVESPSDNASGFIIEEASQGNPQIDNYLSFLNGQYDGSIHLQNHSYLIKDPETGEHQGSNFSANLSSHILANSDDCMYAISVEDFSLECKGNGAYLVNYKERKNLVSSLYGSDVSFSITNQSSSENLVSTMYVPEPIVVESFSPSAAQLSAGTTISWRSDPNFSNDLILILDYRPTNRYSTQEEKELYPNRVSYAKAIPDNGSYTFSSEDLTNFAHDMTIQMLLIRATYGIYQSETTKHTYALAAYSNFNNYFQML